MKLFYLVLWLVAGVHFGSSAFAVNSTAVETSSSIPSFTADCPRYQWTPPNLTDSKGDFTYSGKKPLEEGPIACHFEVSQKGTQVTLTCEYPGPHNNLKFSRMYSLNMGQKFKQCEKANDKLGIKCKVLSDLTGL